MPALSIRISEFSALDIFRLYDIMCLRDRVFVVGQGITAESELDGQDTSALHVEAFDGETLIGTARIFAAQAPIVVGRIAIDTTRQRAGYGSEMMRWINQWLGDREAEMHAQAHLEGWYASLGWRRVGDVFIEAEIPHVTMRWCQSAIECGTNA